MFCPSENQATRWTPEGARDVVLTWERLFGLQEPLYFRAHVEIFHQEQHARDVFLITQGLVLLHCEMLDSNEGVLGVRLAGQIVEQCAAALDMPYPVSARTLLPSVLYKLPVAELLVKQQSNPDIAIFFQHLLRVDLYNAALWVSALKTSNIADRLEGFLRLLGSSLGRSAEGGALRVPALLGDEQLAGLLGCSLRQLKRVKKRMQEQGRLRIERRRTLILPISGN